MHKIDSNYLFFNKLTDFNQSLLNYFFYRMSMFLNCYVIKEPKLKLITSSSDPGRCWFEHWINRVTFVTSRFNSKSKLFYLDKEVIESDILHVDIDDFKYIIPISDIYHELAHVYQFHNNNYEEDDLVEGAAELFTSILTGQINIDYIPQTIGLWYIANNILELKRPDEFYGFVRDSVVNEFFLDSWCYTNKKFIRLLADKYDGDIKKFNRQFRADFGKMAYYEECVKDIIECHNLIFYRW